MRRTRTEALPFTSSHTGPGAGHERDADIRTSPVGHRPRRAVRREHGHEDPATVDADVPAAVGRTLDRLLHERLEAASAIDATFAEDVAARVARFTLDGGRRTRSQFLWWGLRACGGASDTGQPGTGSCIEQVQGALRLAAGLELVQTCALVHDDVMDGSTLRRGRAAVHADIEAQYGTGGTGGPGASFGTAAAVLVGDLALAWADDVVAATPLSMETGRTVRAIWQAMRAEMVAGQYLDLRGQTAGCRSMSEAMSIASLKSGLYSVERPLALGAALAGAPVESTRPLRAAGRCAGLAFQLRDDLAGAFGDPRLTGKPSGDDIRKGKATCLMAAARNCAVASGNDDALALLDAPAGDSGLTEADLARVRSVLVTTGARGLVEDKIQRLVAESVRHLDKAALAPRPYRKLRELFAAVAGVPLGASRLGNPSESPHTGDEATALAGPAVPVEEGCR